MILKNKKMMKKIHSTNESWLSGTKVEKIVLPDIRLGLVNKLSRGGRSVIYPHTRCLDCFSIYNLNIWKRSLREHICKSVCKWKWGCCVHWPTGFPRGPFCVFGSHCLARVPSFFNVKEKMWKIVYASEKVRSCGPLKWSAFYTKGLIFQIFPL